MIVAVSGGFDPLHVGHLDMLEHAACYGQVMVILNSDEWLKRKKGYVFMPWEHRKRILEALECVAVVVPVDDSDGTVCDALRHTMPAYFANGGDRTNKNTPELELCGYLDIMPLFNIGGGKIASSSELVKRAHPG